MWDFPVRELVQQLTHFIYVDSGKHKLQRSVNNFLRLKVQVTSAEQMYLKGWVRMFSKLHTILTCELKELLILLDSFNAMINNCAVFLMRDYEW